MLDALHHLLWLYITRKEHRFMGSDYKTLSLSDLKKRHARLLASHEALAQRLREQRDACDTLSAQLALTRQQRDAADSALKKLTPDSIAPAALSIHRDVLSLCSHPDAPWLVTFLNDQRNANLQSAEEHDKRARATNGEEHYALLRRARGHASVISLVLSLLEP